MNLQEFWPLLIWGKSIFTFHKDPISVYPFIPQDCWCECPQLSSNIHVNDELWKLETIIPPKGKLCKEYKFQIEFWKIEASEHDKFYHVRGFIIDQIISNISKFVATKYQTVLIGEWQKPCLLSKEVAYKSWFWYVQIWPISDQKMFFYRCGGVQWGDGDLALLYESWWDTRRSVVWTFAPNNPQEEKKVLFDRWDFVDFEPNRISTETFSFSTWFCRSRFCYMLLNICWSLTGKQWKSWASLKVYPLIYNEKFWREKIWQFPSSEDPYNSASMRWQYLFLAHVSWPGFWTKQPIKITIPWIISTILPSPSFEQ